MQLKVSTSLPSAIPKLPPPPSNPYRLFRSELPAVSVIYCYVMPQIGGINNTDHIILSSRSRGWRGWAGQFFLGSCVAAAGWSLCWSDLEGVHTLMSSIWPWPLAGTSAGPIGSNTYTWPRGGLGFLTAWWLGAKHEHPRDMMRGCQFLQVWAQKLQQQYFFWASRQSPSSVGRGPRSHLVRKGMSKTSGVTFWSQHTWPPAFFGNKKT